MRTEVNNRRSRHSLAIQSERIDINLFAGSGGMAVGLSEGGFSPTHFFELDSFCCETLRRNIQSKRPTLAGTVHEGDIRKVDWGPFVGKVRLLAGGVPCQPFSRAGKHRAERDRRNLFPEIFRAVRVIRPAAVLIENVRGLLRDAFQPYFEYILRQLQVPSIESRDGESWRDHDQRIRRHQCSFDYRPEYHVSWRLLDAADYGVPQNRHRVFIVATRIDLPVFKFPNPTHSRIALLRTQLSEEYWRHHGLKRPRKINPMNNGHFSLELDDDRLPWVTVRDAFLGLAEPSSRESAKCFNHWVIPGARVYDGHSGSDLDWPSKTIKAGVHGVPGGENILFADNGKYRYFTLRETARLQAFPDAHFFAGARIHVTRQIGNAVPCRLAELIGCALIKAIDSNGAKTSEGRKKR